MAARYGRLSTTKSALFIGPSRGDGRLVSGSLSRSGRSCHCGKASRAELRSRPPSIQLLFARGSAPRGARRRFRRSWSPCSNSHFAWLQQVSYCEGIQSNALCRHRRLRRGSRAHAEKVRMAKQPLRVGVGGPVGSGKTALMEQLCKRLSGEFDIAAITNDIYTKEDARILVEAGALPAERIMGVETGGCPHTAIREDASINLAAIDDMRRRFPALDLILVESGGDNLAATFSPELADLTIYVIDVAGGEKVPRKGGPGVTRSDLLVINKIDLAPYVGASLEVMARDAALMRKTRPFVMANMKTGEGVEAVIAFIRAKGGLKAA